jgi:ribonuclease BN (tRNA processing enzyme)
MRTTSLRVDEDILVDAGTGVGDLSLEELLTIDHVFLTHSHMDHIACLPLLVDTVWEMRDRPIIVHAPAETLDILRAHIFNWAIWPDFTVIPDAGRPALIFKPIAVGEKIRLGARTVTALPANHSVPAVGYLLENENSGALAFTGDTAACEELWDALNQVRGLNYLIAETAFPDAQEQLVSAARHLTPSLLAEELMSLETAPDLYVAHLKPGHVETTSREVQAMLHHLNPRLLRQGHVFDV